MGFLGMLAHWIEVKEKVWNMRAKVIGFKALSSAHSGENLGCYMVGLLEVLSVPPPFLQDSGESGGVQRSPED